MGYGVHVNAGKIYIMGNICEQKYKKQVKRNSRQQKRQGLVGIVGPY